MDQNAGCIIETSTTPTQNHHTLMIRRAFLQFLIPLSIFSFLVSYFPGLNLFAQALDRKYMFLICNGILAFLAKNLKLSSSAGLSCGGFMKNIEEGVKEIEDLPEILKESSDQENAASIAVPEEKQAIAAVQDCEGLNEPASEETSDGGLILESEDEEDEEMEEGRGAESSTLVISDASVSTEELNRKFEEFIRKMKEEIRIEARQQLIAV
ncbi:hypothetical protein Salat_0640600 [Sesamum alatum]|uniref:DUF4408 domain-containing protein n=1 Tax=Sesamum alatum TaxID=300844 RepID=A0AAE2CUA5_9LAMI|nr:hypothetical protein Salat_0640600 [Sesamum alatum]